MNKINKRDKNDKLKTKILKKKKTIKQKLFISHHFSQSFSQQWSEARC